MADLERFDKFLRIAKFCRHAPLEDSESREWQRDLMQRIYARKVESDNLNPAFSLMWRLSFASLLLSVLLHGYYLATQPDIDSQLVFADPSAILSMEYEL